MNLVVVSNRVARAKANEPMTGGLAAALLPVVEKTSLFGTSVHAVLRDAGTAPATLASALRHAGVAVHSIGPVSPSLEDVFLDVVERVAVPA